MAGRFAASGRTRRFTGGLDLPCDASPSGVVFVLLLVSINVDGLLATQPLTQQSLAALAVVTLGWAASPCAVPVYDGVGVPDDPYRYLDRATGVTQVVEVGPTSSGALAQRTAKTGPQAIVDGQHAPVGRRSDGRSAAAAGRGHPGVARPHDRGAAPSARRQGMIPR